LHHAIHAGRAAYRPAAEPFAAIINVLEQHHGLLQNLARASQFYHRSSMMPKNSVSPAAPFCHTYDLAHHLTLFPRLNHVANPRPGKRPKLPSMTTPASDLTLTSVTRRPRILQQHLLDAVLLLVLPTHRDPLCIVVSIHT
jgi:hypothetical protein